MTDTNDSLGFYRGAHVEVLPGADRAGQRGSLVGEVRETWRGEYLGGWLVRFADNKVFRYHNDWLRRL